MKKIRYDIHDKEMYFGNYQMDAQRIFNKHNYEDYFFYASKKKNKLCQILFSSLKMKEALNDEDNS